MPDLRKQQRSRSMLGAQIIFNNRATTLDCQIRNFTDEGAKIVIGAFMVFPTLFEFHVPQRGQTYMAKLIWRHAEEAGIEFLPDERAIAASHGDMSFRVRELEAENAALKRRVNDLKAQLDRYYDQA